MTVIGNHRGAPVVQHIEAARCVVCITDKTGKGAFERIPGHADCPCRSQRSHDVFYLKAYAAVACQWDILQWHTFAPGAFCGHQRIAVHIDRAFALGAVRGHQGVLTVSGKKYHPPRAGRGHGSDQGVCRIQHRVAPRSNVLNSHALDQCNVLSRGDVVQTQVITATDVGHNGHLAAVKAQTFTEYAAARHFKNASIHIRMHQHVARAFRAAAVAAVRLPAVDPDAVGVGHAAAQAAGCEQMGDQARHRGFAVGTGHGNHRHAAIIAGGEQFVDHRAANSLAFAIGGRQVHAQAGRGVDLDNAAVLRFKRSQHAFADHIDAANVQAHHLRCCHCAGGDLGVDIAGHVGGGASGTQVGVVAQHHTPAPRRNGFGRHVLQRQPCHGNIVKADFGQRSCVALAPARVLVDDIDQLPHGVQAVTQNLWRFTP